MLLLFTQSGNTRRISSVRPRLGETGNVEGWRVVWVLAQTRWSRSSLLSAHLQAPSFLCDTWPSLIATLGALSRLKAMKVGVRWRGSGVGSYQQEEWASQKEAHRTLCVGSMVMSNSAHMSNANFFFWGGVSCFFRINIWKEIPQTPGPYKWIEVKCS